MTGRITLAVVLVAACATATATASAAQLDVMADGNGSVSISPHLPTIADENTSCENAAPGSVSEPLACHYVAGAGQQVTLSAAAAPGAVFAGWSDPGCPATSQCTIAVDDDRLMVTALFAPIRVSVKVSDAGNPGTVSTASGALCVDDADTFGGLSCGDYGVSTAVTLVASRPDAVWDASGCDLPVSVTAGGLPACTVFTWLPRWTRVAFEGAPFDDGVPPRVSAHFRVLKRGTGSGTVTGDRLNCGTTCALDKSFGQGETLVAQPAGDSVFAGWRGACSSAPRCSLAVGPVTTLVAVFNRPSHPPPPPPRFVARLGRVVAVGHGRHRSLHVSLWANAPARVTASLKRRHRQAGRGRWTMRAGSTRLRLRVARRARSGPYVLTVSVRGRAGGAMRASRRVRLRR